MSEGLNDFELSEYLFDEWHTIESRRRATTIKTIEKDVGRVVFIISDVDHLSDETKSSFLGKVIASVKLALNHVRIHYVDSYSDAEIEASKYDDSQILIWLDDIKDSNKYFTIEQRNGNKMGYSPSVSAIMMDTENKKKLWAMLKLLFLSNN